MDEKSTIEALGKELQLSPEDTAGLSDALLDFLESRRNPFENLKPKEASIYAKEFLKNGPAEYGRDLWSPDSGRRLTYAKNSLIIERRVASIIECHIKAASNDADTWANHQVLVEAKAANDKGDRADPDFDPTKSNKNRKPRQQKPKKIPPPAPTASASKFRDLTKTHERSPTMQPESSGTPFTSKYSDKMASSRQGQPTKPMQSLDMIAAERTDTFMSPVQKGKRKETDPFDDMSESSNLGQRTTTFQSSRRSTSSKAVAGLDSEPAAKRRRVQSDNAKASTSSGTLQKSTHLSPATMKPQQTSISPDWPTVSITPTTTKPRDPTRPSRPVTPASAFSLVATKEEQNTLPSPKSLPAVSPTNRQNQTVTTTPPTPGLSSLSPSHLRPPQTSHLIHAGLHHYTLPNLRRLPGLLLKYVRDCEAAHTEASLSADCDIDEEERLKHYEKARLFQDLWFDLNSRCRWWSDEGSKARENGEGSAEERLSSLCLAL